jgi:uncharacterized membrane protein
MPDGLDRLHAAPSDQTEATSEDEKMLPDPLHPAIVHFPIVFAVLLPVAVVVGLVAVKRGATTRAAWGPVLALAALLAVSSWVAVQTGEAEEETVERVVSESAIHEHEERAEVFLPLTFVGLLVVGVGLMPGRAGAAARWGSVAVAVAITASGVRLGHSGGELVYVHGAARAYADGGGAVRGDDDRGEEDEARERDDVDGRGEANE